ncbi:MAG: phytanoyl-CoA dioxygenase family protein [Sphingobium sp.]|nr:phytanoyl-CoA dioxygenase family protein [Sphingobium sp.]
MDRTIQHFRDHGWMRVPQAFDADAAAAMRDAVWRELAADGIARDRPSTWTVERPAHLQKLKNDPLFLRVGSERLRAAIDEVLGSKTYDAPRDWGAFFLAFPGDTPWNIPSGGWHVDAKYTSPLWPAGGVKTFALLGDLDPRGGGTLFVSGSHRLVHRWFRANPPPPEAKSADMRKLLMAHPYIRDLHRPGDPEQRIACFMDRAEYDGGIPLQVVEQTGSAGDVFLVHPLVMHVAAPNTTARPRFLLSGGITTDGWGWGP